MNDKSLISSSYKTDKSIIKLSISTIILSIAAASLSFLIMPLSQYLTEKIDKKIVLQKINEVNAIFIPQEKVEEKEKEIESIKEVILEEPEVIPLDSPPSMQLEQPAPEPIPMLATPTFSASIKLIKTANTLQVPLDLGNIEFQEAIAKPTNINQQTHNNQTNQAVRKFHQPVLENQLDNNARDLYKPEPEQPPMMEERELYGDVFITLIVKKDGTVRDVEILQSARECFNKLVLEAARERTFHPCTINGQAVEVRLIRKYIYTASKDLD